MSNQDKWLQSAMNTQKDYIQIQDDQKERMLQNILKTGRTERQLFTDKWRNLFTTYPWRCAFVLSAVQALILTLLLGTQYTNLFIGFFGG